MSVLPCFPVVCREDSVTEPTTYLQYSDCHLELQAIVLCSPVDTVDTNTSLFTTSYLLLLLLLLLMLLLACMLLCARGRAQILQCGQAWQTGNNLLTAASMNI